MSLGPTSHCRHSIGDELPQYWVCEPSKEDIEAASLRQPKHSQAQNFRHRSDSDSWQTWTRTQSGGCVRNSDNSSFYTTLPYSGLDNVSPGQFGLMPGDKVACASRLCRIVLASELEAQRLLTAQEKEGCQIWESRARCKRAPANSVSSLFLSCIGVRAPTKARRMRKILTPPLAPTAARSQEVESRLFSNFQQPATPPTCRPVAAPQNNARRAAGLGGLPVPKAWLGRRLQKSQGHQTAPGCCSILTALRAVTVLCRYVAWSAIRLS